MQARLLIGAPGLTTRNKDATRGKGHRYEQSKDALRLEVTEMSKALALVSRMSSRAAKVAAELKYTNCQIDSDQARLRL